MDSKTKMRMLQQVEKVFQPNVPAMLSVVFAWGSLESFAIINVSSFRRAVDAKPIEFDNIQTLFRYGHFTGKVWIRALTKNLFIDEIKSNFQIIYNKQLQNLNDEKETIEKALTNIKRYAV